MRMILSFRASVFGCDLVGDGVCAESTCKREVGAQPSSPVTTRALLGSQFLRDRLGKSACAVGGVRVE